MFFPKAWSLTVPGPTDSSTCAAYPTCLPCSSLGRLSEVQLFRPPSWANQKNVRCQIHFLKPKKQASSRGLIYWLHFEWSLAQTCSTFLSHSIHWLSTCWWYAQPGGVEICRLPFMGPLQHQGTLGTARRCPAKPLRLGPEDPGIDPQHDEWVPHGSTYGYGSIPIDTFLVGWTSIYQLFWGSLGTRVLTHPHINKYNGPRLHHPPEIGPWHVEIDHQWTTGCFLRKCWSTGAACSMLRCLHDGASTLIIVFVLASRVVRSVSIGQRSVKIGSLQPELQPDARDLRSFPRR